MRYAFGLALAVGVGAVAATAISAALGEPPRDTSPPATVSTGATVSPNAIGGAVAPNARVAALVDAGGTPIRTKGVTSVEHLDVGVYCIAPTSSEVRPVNSITTVSPDYFYSSLNEIMVQSASASSGCAARKFGVYTLADDDGDGQYTFSDAVGFSIVVP